MPHTRLLRLIPVIPALIALWWAACAPPASRPPEQAPDATTVTAVIDPTRAIPRSAATSSSTPLPDIDPRPAAAALTERLRLLLATSPDVPAGDAAQIARAHLERLQSVLGSAAALLGSFDEDGLSSWAPVPDPALWLEISGGTTAVCVGPSDGPEFYQVSDGPCAVDPATVEFYRGLLAATTAEEFTALVTGAAG